MDRRGIAESGGAALACALAAAATFQALDVTIDWALVLGVRDVCRHRRGGELPGADETPEKVADEAPVETTDATSQD